MLGKKPKQPNSEKHNKWLEHLGTAIGNKERPMAYVSFFGPTSLHTPKMHFRTPRFCEVLDQALATLPVWTPYRWRAVFRRVYRTPSHGNRGESVGSCEVDWFLWCEHFRSCCSWSCCLDGFVCCNYMYLILDCSDFSGRKLKRKLFLARPCKLMF